MAPSLEVDDHEGNTSNSHQTNGNTPNGHHTNGHPTNGNHTNGHTTNGHQMNGHNAFAANGFEKDVDTESGMTGTDEHHDDSLYDPIAIIGVGMRLPGAVDDTEALWDMLVNKREGRILVPDSRYNIEAFHSPGKPKPGQVATKYGHFLDHVDLAQMDTSFWSMHGKEMEELDPQQRLALEVSYECLQSSGTTKFKGSKIGSFWGLYGEDWQDMRAKDTQHPSLYYITGALDFAISNRVSYEFGLTGPSMVIRTACSSSLTALHEACMSVQSRDCESAIVGGVNVILAPYMTASMTEFGVLSPEGRCKTFDAGADGYARGEGCVALHIKRLSDAIRDNDPIRAVIRGSCTNSDGRTVGLTQPNPASHAALIRRSHAIAGLEVAKTAMIECHGTGTPVGDPIETKAVAEAFGKAGAYIGSVKPNVGHSEGASGVTSMLKAMLALEKRTIPPNRNFDNPHPNIPWEEAKLIVPTEPTPWPVDRAERIGVNSFGIGGANAHILLESAKSALASVGSSMSHGEKASPSSNDEPRLLTYSASTPESLKKIIESHEAYIKASPEKLDDLSYTLNVRREALPYRSFVVVDPKKLDSDTVLQAAPSERGTGQVQVAFVFTGQGAQWPEMGAQLLHSNKVFRETMQSLEAELSLCRPPPTWSLREELLKAKDESRVGIAQFSQPLCTAVQIGLVNVLRDWGVHPEAVVGHSSGEIGAAYAAKALTAEDAIRAAYFRGLATVDMDPSKGGMAAIGLGRDAVTPFLVQGVVIGCENSPESVTLSGDADKLDMVMEAIRAKHPDVLVRKLRIDRAYHSHHMAAVAEAYQASISDVKASAPEIPFFSSVTGTHLPGNKIELGPSYWVRNLTSPVLFSPAVSALLKHMAKISSARKPLLLEVGPHSALAGPIRQIARAEEGAGGAKYQYVESLKRGSNDTVALLETAGKLFQSNYAVDFSSLSRTAGCSVLTDLPLYPWHRTGPYWSESRISRNARLSEFPQHDVLGIRMWANAGSNLTWRTVLRLDDVPWVREHDISGDIVFPGAGYVAMVGEATRQASGLDDYTVREVHLVNAMVLHDDKETEVVTTLKPVRLTSSLNSATWYEFEISSCSHKGDNWTVHAFGQARGGRPAEASLDQDVMVQPLSRTVPSTRWYNVMRRFGLNYGPRFQGLDEITADPIEKKAVAVVKNEHNNPEFNESPYAIHPAAIDTVFQALGVAAFHGQSRNYNQLAVPSFIGELYVKPVNDKFQLQVDAGVTARGSLVGNALGVTAEHGVVLSLKDIRMSSLGDGDAEQDKDPHAAVELVWKPDINLVDNHALFKHQEDFSSLVQINERLALACMIENYHLIKDLEPKEEFMHKYRSWLHKVEQQALAGEYPNVPDCKAVAQMSSEEREVLIKDAFEFLKESKAWPVATAMHRLLRACQDTFTGAADVVDILLEDDILSRIYDFGRVCDFSDFFSLAAHYRPNLKILEIGAGTGGTTSTILPVLRSEYGERMYYSYTYTDVSNGFFITAKERFQDYEAIDYRVLDISADPLEQGFEEHGFDIIVASNVLHATPNLGETLANVHKLLAPKGRLFLQELWPPTKWINYIMGALSGWWLGGEDGRPEEPYISPSDWQQRLGAAGFKVDAVFDDQQLNSYMVAVPEFTARPASAVTLLHLGNLTEKSQGVKSALESGGYAVQLCDFFETPESYNDIVVTVLDIDKPFVHDMTDAQFSRLKEILPELKKQNSRILWITGAAQINCQDPRYGMTLGLSRVIRTEYELDIATLELDRFDGTSWSAVADVLKEFQSLPQDDGEDLKPQTEWALSDGIVNVGRFHWTSVNNELVKAPSSARKLNITKHGFLSTLQWEHYSPPTLRPGWVRIKNEAVGLNFKDVLIAMGIVEGDGLGCECAGTVTEVGPDVSTLAVGDRVMCIAPGSFATALETHEDACTKIPDELSSVDAASMPVVFCTVIRALIDQAQLEKGQSVLIHSACGGVGIAALYIAQYIGAEIYCTVGTEDKAAYLMQNFNIPRDHIFHSRDASFKRDLLAKTGGRGVDVVLNSLSGELLHASWDCVARFGLMVEIGKRDLIGNGALSLAPFEQNRSYVGVDLGDIMLERPKIGAKLLRKLSTLLEQGHVKPIPSITQFEGAKIEESMRFMQKGDHIGKIVVTMPEEPTELDVKDIVPQKPALTLDGEASYLFVGGLGGLGQAVAVWLAESGAKEIIFLSRSAGEPGKNDAFVQELKVLGCTAKLISGSVAEEQDVLRAVKATNRKIRGVLQASMVLRDRNLPSMTFDDWQAATMPKVKGTWNLHHVLEDEGHTVDFFTVFSSWSGLVGQPGQANYAAGNTFLDAFVQYRRSRGLAAGVIDFGPVDDVGYVSQSDRLLDFFKMTSTYILHEQDILDSIQLLMARSRDAISAGANAAPGETKEIAKRQYVNKSQLALGLRSTMPLSAPGNRTTWKRDPRMALYRNLEAQSTVTTTSTENERLRALLAAAEARPAILDAAENVLVLAEEIGRTLFGFTMKDDSLLDVNQAPSAMGIDSLVAIELRNWFRKSLGIDVTVLQVLESETLLALGTVSAGKLKAKFLAASVDQVEHGYIGEFMKTKVV